jgi:hypothetical protein
MQTVWEKEGEYHERMQIYAKIVNFKKNVSNFLDELKFFFDMSS